MKNNEKISLSYSDLKFGNLVKHEQWGFTEFIIFICNHLIKWKIQKIFIKILPWIYETQFLRALLWIRYCRTLFYVSLFNMTRWQEMPIILSKRIPNVPWQMIMAHFWVPLVIDKNIATFCRINLIDVVWLSRLENKK